MTYWSQFGQDRVLRQMIFRDVDNGVFVDVGAHDGKTLSNTYFFEQLGWTGLCIEANPDVFPDLQKNRTCPCICAAAFDEPGSLRFVQAGMLSGIESCYHPFHRDRVKHEHLETGVAEVPAMTLTSMCDAHGIDRIDLLSIDVEGSELQVLRGMDFGKIFVKVICIERAYPEPAIDDLLKSKGFVKLCDLGCDEIWVQEFLRGTANTK